MNKAELSAKWSKYCDTNQLVDNMMDLLSTYYHRNSEHGVCKLLDEFFTNKEPVIKLLAASNHYIGDLRISTKRGFDRQISSSSIRNFFFTHRNEFVSKEPMRTEDENGKKLVDYLHTGRKTLSLSEVVEGVALKEVSENLSKFHHDGVLYSSYVYNESLRKYMNLFNNASWPTLTNDFQTEDKNAPKLKAGTKTSRAFNAVCHYYGFDKEETYNKTFAQYADLVSALKRNMDFVISVNPLDYLTMSFGVSWNSCHNISGGGFQGGCMSYMLDSTSIITYVVNDIKEDEKIHNIPKYYRQMIHYSNGMFMQNRLYPQENDGATNLYEKFRGFVMEEFNEILDIDEEWTVRHGAEECRRRTESTGVHYKDYLHNNRCNVFYPRSKENEIRPTNGVYMVMTIGHGGICPFCGGQYTESSRLSHMSCSHE